MILTHRGLEPSKSDFFPESSFEAFQDQLSRGFGIEFDPNFSKDGIIISHDNTLRRITNENDSRPFSTLTISEIKMIRYGNQKKGRIPTFNEIMDLIRNSDSTINALHLKGRFQSRKFLDILIDALNENIDNVDKILVFDATPDAARYLKKALHSLLIAPSVSHPYDIKRYTNFTHGTLLSLQEAIRYRNEKLYDWVWLDEWDLQDENNGHKSLINSSVFTKLKNAGYKIALVTPELHGTSPGLLANEAHPDAKNTTSLFKRISEIIALSPDALCTDYPEEVLKLSTLGDTS
jgi:hypothetical protein